MHPDVAKLVEAGRIPQPVGERLSEISPGKFCTHKNWGAGKVKSWDLSRAKVVIDFEKDATIYADEISYLKNEEKVFTSGKTRALIENKYEFNSENIEEHVVECLIGN